MKQYERIIIKDQTGKLFKTKNNAKIFELVESENKVEFLNKTITEKFDSLYQEYDNKKIAIDYIKKIVLATIGTQIGASIVCYDGISTLIPITGILVVGTVASIKPIKLLKKSENNIDLINQIIPCLQLEKVKEEDKIKNLKNQINKDETKLKELEEYVGRIYTEDDLEYIFSNDMKKVKVKVK